MTSQKLDPYATKAFSIDRYLPGKTYQYQLLRVRPWTKIVHRWSCRKSLAGTPLDRVL